MCKDKKVLIFTNPEEHVANRVCDELGKIGRSYVRIDVELFLQDNYQISMFLSQSSDGFSIDAGNSEICSEQIQSVWFRRPRPIVEPDGDKTIALFRKQEMATTIWSLYTCLSRSFWVNHPLHALSYLEHNKARQIQIARDVGLKVPDTLITNVPEDLVQFAQNHGDTVVLKMMRGRAFKREGSDVYTGIYTNPVSAEYLERHHKAIASSPVFAQEYVPKDVELRVTIVGSDVFCCAIHSQDSEKTKHDWRHYDMGNVLHEPHTLPCNVRKRLLEFMDKCQLQYGAIDLILTPKGEYVFLEINPNGQYIWIENLANPGISQAIARLLDNPPPQKTG